MYPGITNTKSNKEYTGILVSENTNGTGDLNFLSANGVYYKILKNKKYKHLRSKTGECIRILGRTIPSSRIPVIEISTFSNEFDSRELIDDLDSFSSTEDITQKMFFDYESFLT